MLSPFLLAACFVAFLSNVSETYRHPFIIRHQAAFDEYYTETDEGPTGPPVDFSSVDEQNNGESFVY
ncbi:hypothetical protein DAPPUDRAFT_330645 [Daphnia pulex]|uniref:Uncharacterized protein n=1 Tax=Daphnia pulex TaxID=6669 RepID=E9HK70_DAPPU|nr:hypothetical protein DAPPUDRAFT_330645 [Daphnia pulex]|eukprot:EFX67883.1 hypothetical protein DAPPUDRAFT_330645 [Daphnia pulex]